MVALGNAWVSGAWRWDLRRRAALATDPLNLLAVDASANRQKGDGDAATWLPPAKAYRCAYVARQIAVKAKFGLSVTAPERDAIARVLATCPEQPLPADSGAPLDVDHHLSDPSTTVPAPAPPGPAAAPSGSRTATPPVPRARRRSTAATRATARTWTATGTGLPASSPDGRGTKTTPPRSRGTDASGAESSSDLPSLRDN